MRNVGFVVGIVFVFITLIINILCLMGCHDVGEVYDLDQQGWMSPVGWQNLVNYFSC